MSIKNLPVFKRPREKLLRYGAHTLGDSELVAILLGGGYKNKNALRLAQTILPSQSLNDLEKMTPDSLRSRKGIGDSRAAVVLAAYEIARRLRDETDITTVQSVADSIQLVSFIKKKRREHFIAIYLNARRQLIQTQVISIGSLDSSIVHPREVYAPALRMQAASLIVAHNHPSGHPDPSRADLLLTKRLDEAGKILGITLLDHIIIAEKGIVSLKEQELM